jgi:tetratricopeptide (TPR) repeat protein
MRLLLLAALLVSAVPAVSAAEEPAPATSAGVAKETGPNAHLAAAVRLYQKLDLDAAIAELQLAEDGAKDSEDDRVQVLIYRGLIFSETGKLSAASDQFKRALAIRPWAEVPEGTSPRIAKNFSDARKSLWGMASVKPPQKKVAAPAPKTVPASDAAVAPPAAQPVAAPADSSGSLDLPTVDKK